MPKKARGYEKPVTGKNGLTLRGRKEILGVFLSFVISSRK
jgi:hypothetical protein